MVGLHVRRGDKAYDQYQGAHLLYWYKKYLLTGIKVQILTPEELLQGSVFGSIDAYIEKARFLDPELATVYVSTDDPSVVESLPWTAKRCDFTLIYHQPSLSLSLSIYIYIHIYIALMCVCVCVCVCVYMCLCVCVCVGTI